MIAPRPPGRPPAHFVRTIKSQVSQSHDDTDGRISTAPAARRDSPGFPAAPGDGSGNGKPQGLPGADTSPPRAVAVHMVTVLPPAHRPVGRYAREARGAGDRSAGNHRGQRRARPELLPHQAVEATTGD